jgi:hypothetical protein
VEGGQRPRTSEKTAPREFSQLTDSTISWFPLHHSNLPFFQSLAPFLRQRPTADFWTILIIRLLAVAQNRPFKGLRESERVEGMLWKKTSWIVFDIMPARSDFEP